MAAIRLILREAITAQPRQYRHHQRFPGRQSGGFHNADSRRHPDYCQRLSYDARQWPRHGRVQPIQKSPWHHRGQGNVSYGSSGYDGQAIAQHHRRHREGWLFARRLPLGGAPAAAHHPCQHAYRCRHRLPDALCHQQAPASLRRWISEIVHPCQMKTCWFPAIVPVAYDLGWHAAAGAWRLASSGLPDRCFGKINAKTTLIIFSHGRTLDLVTFIQKA